MKKQVFSFCISLNLHYFWRKQAAPQQKKQKLLFLFCFVFGLHYFCSMRHKIVIALGSNHRPMVHIRQAREGLSQLINIDRFSRNLWTEAIGIISPRFLNCMAIGTTELSEHELLQTLKTLEQQCGDSRLERQAGRVHLDVDLLRYDDEDYHPNDWKRGYIITLYQEITAT